MEIIQRIIEYGLPIVPDESNELTGEYTFSSALTEEQRYIFQVIAIGWEPVRAKRKILLAETDWTQNQDAVLSIEEKAAWQEYRQALRDIPQDFENPEDVIWPVKPGGA